MVYRIKMYGLFYIIVVLKNFCCNVCDFQFIFKTHWLSVLFYIKSIFLCY